MVNHVKHFATLPCSPHGVEPGSNRAVCVLTDL